MRRTKAGIFLFNIIPSYRPGISKVFDFGYYKLACVPSLGQRVKQNTLYTSLEDAAGENLSDLDLLYIFATENEEFARINWVTPGSFGIVDKTETSPTFTANEGFTMDGDGAYLGTGWTPATHANKMELNDGGVFCWINNDVENQENALGTLSANGFEGDTYTSRIQLFPWNSGDSSASYAVNSTVALGTGDTVVDGSIGFYHAMQVAADDHRYYKNKVLIGSNALPFGASGMPTRELLIGRVNVPAGVSAGTTEYQFAMVGVGKSLAGKQDDLYDAWNTYFSSL